MRCGRSAAEDDGFTSRPAMLREIALYDTRKKEKAKARCLPAGPAWVRLRDIGTEPQGFQILNNLPTLGRG